MSEKFPWYEIVDNSESILQGDFFFSCPIFVPSPEYSVIKEDETVPVEVVEYNVIVMSQSCDLIQKKISLVLVCPVWNLSDFELKNDFIKSKKGKETLRQGNVPGYHLLNVCELDNFKRGYIVVDFRETYSVPYTLMTDIAKKQSKRVRLLPPYREHLSQAYARFFMRVGLPIDIPAFR